MQLIPSRRGAGFRSWPVLVAAWIALFVAWSPAPLAAQALSPYSDFQAMTPGDLATLQIKLTYVGPTDEPVASVMIVAPGNPPSIAGFVPFRRPAIEYANEEDVAIRSFTASTSELEAIIDQVGLEPQITAGAVTQPARVSFALYNSAGGERVFESVTDQTQAAALFARLRAALAQNPAGLAVLDGLACVVQTMDPATPTEVTSSVSATLSGFRRDHAADRFVTRARVVNNTGSPIAGPVTLVLRYAGSGYRLTNGTGTTCALSPLGADYVTLDLPGGLQPGVPVNVKLEFVNPDRLAIRLSVAVFAGTGAR
jgi:hypothetical protein